MYQFIEKRRNDTFFLYVQIAIKGQGIHQAASDRSPVAKW